MGDIYMQIDGIKGDSTDSEHKDWIEILSFSQTVSQPAPVALTSTGGETRARTEHQDFVVNKYVDLASPKLYEACSTGKQVKSATIKLKRSSKKGKGKVEFLVFKMDQVFISQVTTSGNGDSPTESLTLNYGKINWTYTAQ
jgi:type VI secretion system secreted protein Hcp